MCGRASRVRGRGRSRALRYPAQRSDMPGRMEMTESNAVDIGKRYDIYVAETESHIVVYRGAFVPGVTFLEMTRTFEFGSALFEVEQANGLVLSGNRAVRRHDPGNAPRERLAARNRSLLGSSSPDGHH